MQVKDDLALLETMSADMRSASRLYNPTNYWDHYEKIFLPELQTQGLKDFRRREKSVLRSFGATDLEEDFFPDLRRSRLLNNRFIGKSQLWQKFLLSATKRVSSMLTSLSPVKKNRDDRYIRFVQAYAKNHSAPDLSTLSISLIGNPKSDISGYQQRYTYSMLYYYMRFSYMCKWINFKDVNTIVELGSGSGKSVEIMKKTHPNITFLLFDISPQLYVCQQYLSEVFPGDLIGYRETRNIKLDQLRKGKIYIFGAWDFPLLEKFRGDVFMNCASFQEMEPDVVSNYLHYVNGNFSSIYIMAKMDGQKKAQDKNTVGVIDPVVLANYERGLTKYTCIDREKCFYPNGLPMWHGYEDSMWKPK